LINVLAFISSVKEKQSKGAIPFDTFGAEFTHHGEDCTFETMLKQFGLSGSKGLSEIGEIVHDMDLKDDKFHRLKAAVLNAIIDGLSKVLRDDRKRLQQTGIVFDGLHALMSQASEQTSDAKTKPLENQMNDECPRTHERREVKIETTAVLESDQTPSWREVFLYFLMLGFINVGGPVAQITMMYSHMVERRHWLSEDRFVKIMAFCHMLPGPEALQLAIYVGYLKRKLLGGILAGLTFIIPGAVVMIVLSWLYVTYGSLPQVNNVLYILKPAVLGIIAAGILKLGRAAIRSLLLGALLIAALVGMRFAGVNFLLILVLAGLLNVLIVQAWPIIRRPRVIVPTMLGTLIALPLADSLWLQMAWLFLKTGLFSFGGAYASIVFLERGAVQEHHWLTNRQLLDGVALSVATPGPFMLFTTFTGFLAGGLRGAIIATFFVFLPSFLFVLTGAPYIEMVRHNRWMQAFLAGASAAVVGVVIAVSLELIPAALTDLATVTIALVAFFLIVVLKVDVARVAVGAIAGGIFYAVTRGLMAWQG
jgi:chromate transporter